MTLSVKIEEQELEWFVKKEADIGKDRQLKEGNSINKKGVVVWAMEVSFEAIGVQKEAMHEDKEGECGLGQILFKGANMGQIMDEGGITT